MSTYLKKPLEIHSAQEREKAKIQTILSVPRPEQLQSVILCDCDCDCRDETEKKREMDKPDLMGLYSLGFLSHDKCIYYIFLLFETT